MSSGDDSDKNAADRTEAVKDLVRLRLPAQDAIDRLARYPWDREQPLVVLGGADLQRVLRLFTSGDLGPDDVERWANRVEGRDDIGYDESSSSLLRECIFELANPEITRRLTPDAADQWLARLPSSE